MNCRATLFQKDSFGASETVCAIRLVDMEAFIYANSPTRTGTDTRTAFDAVHPFFDLFLQKTQNVMPVVASQAGDYLIRTDKR